MSLTWHWLAIVIGLESIATLGVVSSDWNAIDNSKHNGMSLTWHWLASYARLIATQSPIVEAEMDFSGDAIRRKLFGNWIVKVKPYILKGVVGSLTGELKSWHGESCQAAANYCRHDTGWNVYVHCWEPWHATAWPKPFGLVMGDATELVAIVHKLYQPN